VGKRTDGVCAGGEDRVGEIGRQFGGGGLLDCGGCAVGGAYTRKAGFAVLAVARLSGKLSERVYFVKTLSRGWQADSKLKLEIKKKYGGFPPKAARWK